MFLIAGPCAIENKDVVMQTACVLKNVCERLGIDLYFKSSFDKANRTSNSPRGIGIEEGLSILQEVKDTYHVKIITDVHESWQCQPVSQVVDVLQIPSFLSRQTDLLLSAAKTGNNGGDIIVLLLHPNVGRKGRTFKRRNKTSSMHK